MQLAHVSPSGLRGGDHAFAVTRSESDLQWLLRIDDDPIQEAV